MPVSEARGHLLGSLQPAGQPCSLWPQFLPLKMGRGEEPRALRGTGGVRLFTGPQKSQSTFVFSLPVHTRVFLWGGFPSLCEVLKDSASKMHFLKKTKRTENKTGSSFKIHQNLRLSTDKGWFVAVRSRPGRLALMAPPDVSRVLGGSVRWPAVECQGQTLRC